MTISTQQQDPNILIVDDKPANLLLLVRMLAGRGYKPRTVLGGELALQAARAEPPDLILLDVAMPQMNGYEVCELLKADAVLKDIPVIFISALNDTLDKVKAFHAGAADYVTKPFHLEEVLARVETHLRLRRLEKLRDDLTHMIVHDLRNPLTVIRGFLEILERNEDHGLSASAKDLVTIARRSSILDVSKLAAGEMKLQRQPCDLEALIRDVLAATQPLPGDRTVTLEAPKSALPVPADAALLRRVLQNLLGNALRYTPIGGDVRIVVTPSASEVRVAVTDAGPGVAPENQQRIFEKFGQVEDRRNRQGTGLGLAFCKLAVEAHAGRIGVDSALGRGSTFWFALPLTSDLPVIAQEGARP